MIQKYLLLLKLNGFNLSPKLLEQLEKEESSLAQYLFEEKAAAMDMEKVITRPFCFVY